MAKSYADSTEPGLFLPTSYIFDVETVNNKSVDSAEFKELLIRIRQAISEIAYTVNLKDTGIYSLEEFVNGQIFFADPTLSSSTAQTPEQRQNFRKVIDFGALPNTATKSVAHGITFDDNSTGTRIYATATNPAAAPAGLRKIPIPYASPVLVNNIEIDIDSTNINITTGSNRTAFTRCIVVIEFLRN